MRFTPIRAIALLALGMLAGITANSSAEDPTSLSITAGGSAQPNGIELGFDKPSGRHLFLEESGDFSKWDFLPQLWVGDGNRESLSLPREHSARFFRLSNYPIPVHTWVTATANTSNAAFRLFYSNAIQRPVSYYIHLPAAYANEPLRRFPVIYWLHGSGGEVSGVAPISQMYANAMNLGLMPPVIIVFANGLTNGMWCDSKNGVTPMESIVINDLIPHVDATYRTIATREGRIVEGFSMGGYGAGRLGLKFAAQFRGLSMMGAGPLQLDFLNDPNALTPVQARQKIFANVYGSDSDYFEAQSPWRQAEQNASSLPQGFTIRMIVGTADPMLTNNQALRTHFQSLGIIHSYQELSGVGHDPVQTLNTLGLSNWQFYSTIFPP